MHPKASMQLSSLQLSSLVHRTCAIGCFLVLLATLGLTQTASPAAPATPESNYVPPTPQDPALPTLFLIGDSTVRNGSGLGAGGLWGWGEPLVDFFDTAKINVVNRARGGRSSRTFINEGLWDQALALIKPGDYVLIQFGHNDSSPLDDTARARGTLPGIGEESRDIFNPIMKKQETVHTYGWYMRKYVKDTQAKGATPIICSPIPRDTWKDGKIVRNADNYGGLARQIAAEFHIGFINLNEIIAQRYDSMGQSQVNPLFPSDHTHTSKAGAEINAEAVVAGLKSLPGNPFARYLSARAALIAAWKGNY
jgi:lysophospholipase L1-like esterase